MCKESSCLNAPVQILYLCCRCHCTHIARHLLIAQMAYRLDSLRIIDAEPTASTAPTERPQPSRSFGFTKAVSPCKPSDSTSNHASPIAESRVVRSAASPTEFSGNSSASPSSNLFAGSYSPPSPTKRVGISPHNEYADWDFLKSGATCHSSHVACTEPGLIMSTLPRGLAHAPERRPLTEAEVILNPLLLYFQ
jgi:hypothetical protein